MECTANIEMPRDCAVSAGWNVQLILRCLVTAVSAGWTVQLILRCLVTVLFLLGGLYS